MEAGGGWRVSNKMESISNYGTHIHRVLHTRQVRKQPPLCHWLTGGPSPPPITHSPLPFPTRNYPPPHPRSRPYSCPAEKQSKFFLYFNTRGSRSYVPSTPLCLCLYKWSILPTYTHTHTNTHKFTCTTIYLYCSLLFLAKMTTHK